MRPLVIGARGSKLSLWQANSVAERLAAVGVAVDPVVRTISTSGDRDRHSPLHTMGGQGVFVREIESALQAGRIDVAVHSLKDLPVRTPPGLTIAAIVKRDDARDALVSACGRPLDQLPPGAAVGTSSLRRSSQVLAARPELQIMPLRGNVDTRLRKLDAGMFDAIVLAAAGLLRLGLGNRITQYLSLEQVLPAPGQGALAVEARADDPSTMAQLACLDHAPTRAAVTAERALLAALGGGCHLPVAAYAEVDHVHGTLRLRALIAAPDGSRVVRAEMTGQLADARRLGVELAEELLSRGGREAMEQ